MRLRDFRRLRSEVSKSPIHFHTALGDPSCAFGAALLQGPTHGADSLSFPFIPPRGSILRLWRGPSPRAYSWCGFTLFSFHSASRIHPAPLARPFSKGLLMVRMHSLFLSFRLGGSILRLWRGPSPRAYSWSRFTLFSFHSASRIHPVPLTRPFSRSQPPTPPKGKEPAFADSFPRSCFQP